MSFVVTVRVEFSDQDAAQALADKLGSTIGSDGQVDLQEYKFPTVDDLAGIPNPDSPIPIEMQPPVEDQPPDGT